MDSTTPSTVTDVTCQQPNCPARTLALSTQAATDERARAGGWRIWDGAMLGGTKQRRAICPEHARVPRPRKPVVQEYDEPLW